MAGQDQLIVPRRGLKAAGAGQPVAQWVGLGLGRVDADVGGNAGQQLIAADDQRVIEAPQRRMVGGMAMAETDLPAAACGMDHIALGQAGEAKRQGCHAIGKVERAFRGFFRQHRGADPGALIEQPAFRGGAVLHVQHQHPRQQPGGAGDQQFHPPRLKPAGEADMVGVVVGDQQAGHRPASQRPVDQRRPQRGGPGGHHAGIDQHPARRIFQRIDIHMVQRHRQRQAHPQDAGGDFHGFARCWRGLDRVAQASHHAPNSAGDKA